MPLGKPRPPNVEPRARPDAGPRDLGAFAPSRGVVN